MSDIVLRFARVSREYRSGDGVVRALDAVSFEVAAGEMVAVMGPSGSGKSTLLALAGGLDSPTSGSVSVEAIELGGLNPTALARLRRDQIGYVFQDYNLVTDLTVAENVALPRELAGVGSRAARREAQAALAEVGMDDLAHRFPDQLSGGQQQRVAIARALIGQRRLVLADEPTGALDSHTSEAVLEVLRDRVAAGAAGVMVTHEPRYASWADRTIFLRDGRLVDSTGPRTVPEHLLGSDA
ncbi:ABC transporter ATP-binding protein [Micromonospora polyrhachis]|uniref:Putative ABC transport system ATP-binding protein n=1 Tax=Micromonospora polyrhachis TaxID=1282883 RepID=A0A7W7SKV5_9ACTN|nr:ABC transporter ATP-binding protein [Micromonospora polyrhachis]MBB4956647.1 putative ABC transport system ATP-binding protein [Micromonospora polyrhachis]